MEMKEQLVFISGASRGLGASLARSFAREGARVVINYYQSRDIAEALAEELGDRAFAVYADIRDETEVGQAVTEAEAHFDRPVTTIVNNALVGFKFDPAAQKAADRLSWEDYQTQLDGSLKGPFHLVQACLPGMKAAGFGRIINVGTNLVQNPVVAYHEYTTAKAALLGFTRNMAKELGAEGITVNMVSGGLLRETDASRVTSDEVFGIIEATTPLQRVTTPDELADAVLFFSSPWSRAVTGQNLVVDGGLVMD
ncbi:3-oxoacyl-ACP reductase [Alkalicoccus chagannorensis]|uniref:3-oxoacyl-ACP reductase n=1 Tax=Alkalicoccus chagannorensis TaxID=427072 RepID=UPI00041B8CD0|nr:3-oxoacyl-ACP reductase [Alkalicoccus chagannorensis]